MAPYSPRHPGEQSNSEGRVARGGFRADISNCLSHGRYDGIVRVPVNYFHVTQYPHTQRLNARIQGNPFLCHGFCGSETWVGPTEAEDPGQL